GSAGNMMKPFLVARGISVMGTTTGEEYRKHIEKDPALARRFQQMVLGQPNREATLFITEKLWPGIKSHHGITEDISKKDLEYIVDMTNRYAPAISQPSKAETALDDAAANAKQRHSDIIERRDIVAAVSQMSKLSVDFLSQNDSDRFLRMEKELPEQVLGQPGIQRVVDGLIGSRSGLSDPNQPWAAFVFQGPTGTGKTELSKALARYLFGDETALIQLNMADYSEKHTVSRLVGAPPGYVGFEDSEPALTERIRQRPYSILLLDEIEKAHPDVFNVLLPVLNDGVMTDNHGKKVLFNNVIVVMTTNLGAKEAMAYLNGAGSADDFGLDRIASGSNVSPEEQEQKLSAIYAKERKKFFRPEMINRIEELGGFVTFIPLAQEVITKLVTREIEKVNKRMSDPTGAVALNPSLKDVNIEVGADARIQLAAEGYKPDMGARPLRKVVREKISNPLGKWLMANKEQIADFVAKNGPAKIIINELPTKENPFNPQLVSATVSAEVSNDNKTAATPAATHRKKRGGPTL
ncbi:MAG TPA: AAA family ATPase, partial [Patescibacteria group bacterium]|nr:AAA family ATPase [Patescibacteria group bacterium]